MRIVAGCDGGGTKCAVQLSVLADDNSVVSTVQATSGPANVRSNPQQALASIQDATRKARQLAGLADSPPLDTFVAALAGAGASEQQQLWQRKLSDQLPARSVSILPDVVVLFASVQESRERDAVATIIGTGSIAWAKRPDGTMQRAGGLGPAVGDEGSGFWIGKEALHRCRHRDWLGISDRLTKDLSTTEIAKLASSVFGAAKQDAEAAQIVSEAAAHIAKLLLDATATWSDRAENDLLWICAGGVAVNQPEWLERIGELCGNAGLRLSSPLVVREPVVGAWRLAQVK